jgi:predicted RNA-binding protein with TRAM domain
MNGRGYDRRGGGRFGGGGGRFGGGGGRYDSSSIDIPKPVKPGEEYDVEISEVGSRGDGIARVKNFVVFVNGVKQGDKVKIKITEVRNRFAIGEVVGKGEGPAAATEEQPMKEVQAEEQPVEVQAEEQPVEVQAEEQPAEVQAEEEQTKEVEVSEDAAEEDEGGTEE